MRRLIVGRGAFLAARELHQALAAPTGDLAVEVAWLQLGAGFMAPLVAQRCEAPAAPFRAPHHTVSTEGMLGGTREVLPSVRALLAPKAAMVQAAVDGTSYTVVRDRRVAPGEASLAHGGTLLLDQLPEWRRSTVEALGAALRQGYVLHLGARLPARPQLVVATADLCACGSALACRCSREQHARYQQRLAEYAELLGITELEAAS